MDYLWFIVNPLKQEVVRRKVVRDFYRIISEQKSEPRKKMLDSIEDYIMKLHEDDDAYERVVK